MHDGAEVARAPTGGPDRRRAAWLAALAASAALHGGLLVAAWATRPKPRTRPAPPIDVVLVERPPAAVAPETPATWSAVAAAANRRPASAPATAGTRSRPPAAGAPVALPPASTGPGPPLEELAPGSGSRAARADLSPPLPPEIAAKLVAPEPTSSERLERILAEDFGRAKVERGLADSFTLDMGKALLKSWEPEKVVTERGLSGYAQNLGRNVAEYAGIYADQAARYGKTGSPVDGTESRGVQALAAVPEGLASEISRQREAADAVRAQSRTRHVAVIRVVQRADGRLVSVELVSPSRDSAVDAAALRDVRAAAERLPAPSPEALHGRKTLASTWELELDVSITPPLPMVAVQFDEVLGFVDARVPLDRRLYKVVRLVSVE